MGKRYSREFFEDLYTRSVDPWEYETRQLPHMRYERTLEVLSHRRYARALEVGCSIGVFTELLAPLCDELVTIDMAQKAVDATRKRVANFPNIRVERRVVPEEMPNGPFDLIVASDVLYYLPEDLVLVTLQRFENALRPGGAFLSVHYRGNWKRRFAQKIKPLFLRYWVLKNRGLNGDAVHALLLEHTRLAHKVSLTETKYLLDLWGK